MHINKEFGFNYFLLKLQRETIENQRRREIMSQLNNQEWLNIIEAAQYMRVSERTIRRAIKGGTLKFKKPTKKYLFHKTWLHSWICGYGKKLSPTQKNELKSLQESQ